MADPQVFMAAIIRVFCEYPEDVVRRVTEPGRGLSAKLKWCPTIAEVREACEIEMQPMRARMDAYRRYAETQRLIAPHPQTAEDRAAVLERVQPRLDELRRVNESLRETPAKPKEKTLSQLAAEKDAPITISPALRDRLAEQGFPVFTPHQHQEDAA